jgi:hypothetical protein
MALDEQSLRQRYPNLAAEHHAITSEADPRYNCIAFAAGDSSRWWQPLPLGGYYWPPEVQRAWTLDSYRLAYESLGYVPCPSGDVEAGYEKVAIYVDAQDVPTHAARQLPSGNWTSKLGQNIDIEHASPAGVEGSAYGRVALYMRRRTTDEATPSALARLIGVAKRVKRRLAQFRKPGA